LILQIKDLRNLILQTKDLACPHFKPKSPCLDANDSAQDISQANESEGAACGRAVETHPSAAKAALI
jgi:hypothetical protein